MRYPEEQEYRLRYVWKPTELQYSTPFFMLYAIRNWKTMMNKAGLINAENNPFQLESSISIFWKYQVIGENVGKNMTGRKTLKLKVCDVC